MNKKPQNIQDVETGVGYNSILVRTITDKTYYSFPSENLSSSDNSDDATIRKEINERHKNAWKKLADM